MAHIHVAVLDLDKQFQTWLEIYLGSTIATPIVSLAYLARRAVALSIAEVKKLFKTSLQTLWDKYKNRDSAVFVQKAREALVRQMGHMKLLDDESGVLRAELFANVLCLLELVDHYSLSEAKSKSGHFSSVLHRKLNEMFVGAIAISNTSVMVRDRSKVGHWGRFIFGLLTVAIPKGNEFFRLLEKGHNALMDKGVEEVEEILEVTSALAIGATGTEVAESFAQAAHLAPSEAHFHSHLDKMHEALGGRGERTRAEHLHEHFEPGIDGFRQIKRISLELAEQWQMQLQFTSKMGAKLLAFELSKVLQAQLEDPAVTLGKWHGLDPDYFEYASKKPSIQWNHALAASGQSHLASAFDILSKSGLSIQSAAGETFFLQCSSEQLVEVYFYRHITAIELIKLKTDIANYLANPGAVDFELLGDGFKREQFVALVDVVSSGGSLIVPEVDAIDDEIIRKKIEECMLRQDKLEVKIAALALDMKLNREMLAILIEAAKHDLSTPQLSMLSAKLDEYESTLLQFIEAEVTP